MRGTPFLDRWPWRRRPARRGLVLAGGGVIGGMYEVGALAALEETVPGFNANTLDVYVGSSAGSVVAALMANGIRPRELYTILDEGRDDPLNFQRGAIFHRGASAGAAWNFAQVLWAVGKNVVSNLHLDWPDILARSQGEMPPGFYSLRNLEEFIRQAFAARGLSNDFRSCARPLLIPAIDIDRGERVVFGRGRPLRRADLRGHRRVVGHPGFFEPYHIGGRDYVDGDVGFTGHADLAVEAGARLLIVVESSGAAARGRHRRHAPAPRPLRHPGAGGPHQQPEPAGGGLRELLLREPDLACHLVQPPADGAPVFGPSMGFEASRQALRFGYTSTREWVAAQGAALKRRFAESA